MRAQLAFAVACCAGAALAAQTSQSSSPAPQSSPPLFRSGIDVVQLDVSVIDKNRLPIQGLGRADFRISEDGDDQSIVGVDEVTLPDRSHASAAWLHLVPPDVETNALRERVGAGQVIVVVFDDAHLSGMGPLLSRVRGIAYGVVDRMSGLDQTALFSTERGLTESFTNDPDRLRASIAAYRPHAAGRAAAGSAGLPAMSLTPAAPALAQGPCERADPTIPALLTLTRSLAQIPQRRKTIILISTGDAGAFVRPASGCASLLSQAATDLFWQAQRANINIDTFDPNGDRPPEPITLTRPRILDVDPANASTSANPQSPAGTSGPATAGVDTGTGDRGGGSVSVVPAGGGAPPADRSPRAGGRGGPGVSGANSLSIIADSTGGAAIAHATAFDDALDRLFEANRSYYLVSYRTTHHTDDGKYRRIAVSVRRAGATALTRRGYFAPSAASHASADSSEAMLAAEAARMGISTGRELVLRATVAPFARLDGAGDRPSLTALTVTIGLRTVVPRLAVTDHIEVFATSETPDGRPIDQLRQSLRLPITPGIAADGRYEATFRMDLPPGRQSLRLNVYSALADKSGTVSTDLDVPDLSSSELALSGLVFEERGSGRSVVDWMASSLIPVVPTTVREFAAGERTSIYCRVYQRGSPQPVAITGQIVGADDQVGVERTSAISASQFSTAGSADYRLDLPTSRLGAGAHLLDLKATLPDGTSARRMATFFVK